MHSSATSEDRHTCCHTCDRCSDAVVRRVGTVFGRCGKHVATYPLWYIVTSIVFTLCFIPGIVLFFYEETDQDKLWLPKHSHIYDQKKWVNKYFPTHLRFQDVIIVGENVLMKDFILEMLDLDEKIRNISGNTPTNFTFYSTCSVINNKCQVSSLLEVWEFNATRIKALTNDDIVRDVNDLVVSPISGLTFNPLSLLFDYKINRSGIITNASATRVTYKLWMDHDDTDRDSRVLSFEKSFYELLRRSEKSYATFKELYFNNILGYDESITNEGHRDYQLLLWGLLIVAFVVCLTLGGYSLVHHRFLVAIGGLVSVGMSLVVTLGFYGYLGIPFGPVHDALPFLMMGISVDEMFEIMSAVDLVNEQSASMATPKKVSRALHHAGVSIAITTATDVIAFGLGGKAHLPCVSHFCLYAMMAIFTIFVFKMTFFIACVSINERRSKKSHDAICICYKHDDYKANKFHKVNIVQESFKRFIVPWLEQPLSKFIVVVGGLVLAGVMMYGVTQLDHYYDPTLALAYDNPAYRYVRALNQYFPSPGGISTAIYTGKIDYYRDKEALLELQYLLNYDDYIVTGSARSWYKDFIEWIASPEISTLYSDLLDPATLYPSNSSNFYQLLNVYKVPDGPGYRNALYFKMEDGVIVASMFPAYHISLKGVQEELEAMHHIQHTAHASGYNDTDCFSYSHDYGTYEINEVMKEELFLHIAFGLSAVFFTTCILVANPAMCVVMLIVVFVTLIDMGGTLYFIGRSIDSLTSLNTILSIGIAIDYPVHVGHAFMHCVGKTREERVFRTLVQIGPVVFFGAFTTFLSIILLSVASTYKYNTFFEIFALVVGYGFFNSTFFMPVILSYFGPQPYLHLRNETEKHDVHEPATLNHNGVTTVDSQKRTPMETRHDNTQMKEERCQCNENCCSGNNESEQTVIEKF